MLAYLSNRLGSGAEDLATEALAFLLRTPAAATGLLNHARRSCPLLTEPARYRTQDRSVTDDGIPDLVGVGPDGTTPLIIEAKFGAALTANQPVTYLQRLLDREEPSLLLFLVPTRREAPIWAELQRRCADAGMELVCEGGRSVGQWGNITVAVSRWQDLLRDLELAPVPVEDHRRQLSELEQLRGLCEREDRNLFRPFTSEFLNGDVGQRLLDLDELLNEVVNVLASEGEASTKGLRWSSGQGWFGRYVKLAEWECLLKVDFRSWGRESTPLWLRITDTRAPANQDLLNILEPLVGTRHPRFINDGGLMQFSIGLPHGSERDEVFAAVDAQVREVLNLLRACPPTHPGENAEEI